MINDTLQSLKTPATAMLVYGIINGSVGFLALAGGVFRLFSGGEDLPVQEAERIGFIFGTVVTYGIAFGSLAVAPFVIYGAVQMMGGKKYGIAKAAAILSFVPITSCCFVIGIPVGIWCFVVLRRPDVRDLFEGRIDQIHAPPQPPSYGI